MNSSNPSLAAGGVNFLSRPTGFFPDPFDDLASQAMPRTMADAMRWSERIFTVDGTYRQAMDRVASYFITDVEVTAATGGKKKTSREEKEKFEEFLTKTLRIATWLHRIALDYLCYGNSFTSILVPFRRYLSCPECHMVAPLRKVYNTPDYKFQWKDFDFHASCPSCKYQGRWDHIDRRGNEEDIRIKRWSPHEIEILHDQFSDDKAYIWNIPEKYKKEIRVGTLWHLEHANWEVIQAIKHNNKLLFDPGYIYHMMDPALAGFDTGGWGLSKSVTNFRQAWYCQVLRRYNEAIATDYIIPFRVITPAAKSGSDPASSDPVLGQNLGSWQARVRQMLRVHRRDPAAWNVLPFPIEYQALGGEASSLAPFQLIDQGIDQLLNASGVPAELYKGSLTVQVAPAALRLFESHWSHLVDSLNEFLEDMVDKIAKVLQWAPVDAALTRVTHADDMNRQMAKLQLMMGRQLSQTTGLKSIGESFEQEQIRILEEQQFVDEKTREMQEEMQGQQAQQQAAQGGAAPHPGGAAPPQGGAPPAGGAGAAAGPPTQPDVPTTPQELWAKTEQIAGELAGMPEGERTSQLIQLKKQDVTLHSLVRAKIDEIRNKAKQQGGDMVMQQQYGKQGAAPAVGIVSLMRGRLRKVA